MADTVFISYDFKDDSFRGEVQSWLKDSGYKVVAVQEKNLHPESDKAVARSLSAQIRSCNHVLVLVGNNTHNRPWVDHEVAVAQSQQINVQWVRLPNRTGAPPPEIANKSGIPYNRTSIIRSLV